MSLDGAESFEVFHGTQAERDDLLDGLSGLENYHNLGLDPFSAFGYKSVDKSQKFIRVSVWKVLPSEIKPRHSVKWASIKRPFTAIEKERHMTTFRRVIENSPELPVAKRGMDKNRILESEAERPNGLPGERLSMVVEFTIDQRNKLGSEPVSFKAMILRSVDNGLKPYSIEELEDRFLASCPDIEKMRVYDAEGRLQSVSGNRNVLLKLYRQSLLATAHSMRYGDQMAFVANDLYDMKERGFLEKNMEYYQGRGRGYEIWVGWREEAKKYEDEILKRYPELAPVVGA